MASNLPGFKWLENVLPDHIPHRFSRQMAEKSTVIPVRLILKDEKKYEDCVAILRETQGILREVQGERFDGEQPTKCPRNWVLHEKVSGCMVFCERFDCISG